MRMFCLTGNPFRVSLQGRLGQDCDSTAHLRRQRNPLMVRDGLIDPARDCMVATKQDAAF
ncbi:hypothetical protein C7G43_23245 [Bradyrhizobium sp. MOS004]|nr:hypothetical protein C7G43_23245 [Bradyrhizobium sp. MOS004]HAR18022.1 hypothetical protein [Bradyrhizobium sp.]HBY31183.1 hypothetical protein [Bradyrhizobium sp.]